MDVLRVANLEKSFGRRKVVQDVSMRVGPSEIVGLLGPNGAGKSTSFRMTCGLIQPDKGQIFLGEKDVTQWPMFMRAREGGMGYLAQEPSIFRKLTVEQNISAVMEMLGYSWGERQKKTDELLERLDIKHVRGSKASVVSGGQRRRLEIARCLISNPKIIMLDEPYAGIDPKGVQSMRPIIKDLRDSGISILITDHAAMEILDNVDRCYVIDAGKVLCEGDPRTVEANPEVRRIYLGNPAESARFAAAGTTSYESTNQSGKTTASSASNGADKVVRRVADKTERVDGPVSESTQAPHAKKNILDRFALRRRS